MKTNTFLLFFILLSFNSNCQNSVENDSLKVIGKWGMYVTRTSQVDPKNPERLVTIETVCNACPEIEFSSDKLAKIGFPNGNKEEYSWSIKSGKIRFRMLNGNSSNRKLDNEYNIKITDKKSYLEMEMEVIEDESYTYILRK